MIFMRFPILAVKVEWKSYALDSRPQGSRVLWRYISTITKNCDDGGSGLFEIAWRHLWTTTCLNLPALIRLCLSGFGFTRLGLFRLGLFGDPSINSNSSENLDSKTKFCLRQGFQFRFSQNTKLLLAVRLEFVSKK